MADKISTHPSLRIPDCQLLIVTGKGGVGKTAVSTALATACARAGKRTLLTVYERDDCQHPLIDARVGFDTVETEPNLWLSRLDSRLSMKEYIHRTVPLHLLYDWILNGRTLGQFTDAAPGFDELMCLGKLYDLAEGSAGKQTFDTIIFDAPSTGHSALILRTPSVMVETVGSGPIHQSALKVQAMLQDRQRSCILVVALAEEMALQEGSELLDYVGGELQFNTGPMIINRLRPARFTDREIEQLRQRSGSATADVRAIIDNAAVHHRLCGLQQGYLDAIHGQYPAILKVPQLIQRQFDAATIVDGIAAALEPNMEAIWR